ncbi:mechanosensitive ion channel family protein [Methylobacter psychrophilus]|uniref:mechanosensitive ion channel family protein n=1 Tax=Methylobacter psychrophilus TaxID=96941 RepID=UPI0021D49B02|nr:mechanosensitive ion channel family protein [Methylobacter psychrophilus]
MINKFYRLLFIPKLRLVAVFLALGILQLWAIPVDAGVESPLKPIDTSSPRSTFKGFLELMNKGYVKGVGTVESYLASSRLYLSPEEVATIKRTMNYQESARRTLDLSELPPAMVGESSRQLAIQLKEVIDRIDLPPIESIPDTQAMAKSEFKRWTLPNSEIRIQRVEKGPRIGEYLFTPETLSRIPEFYAMIKDLPYNPGASVGWNDYSSYSPTGVALALYRIVPPRWLIDAPRQKVRTTFLDQPLWRWFGIVAVLGISFIFVLLCFRLSRCWASQTMASGQWANLLRPVSLMVVTSMTVLIFSQLLRVSGSVYEMFTLSLWALFYLAFTWAVWVAGGAVAVCLSDMEKLQVGSIDSQLIRLVIRLITVIVAIAILVAGADRIGLPAYSVIAGLGVGGLAVALAAQQTLANLLGSLIIMFEKPFAIGHWIKLKDIEGIVEKVGFRSTRIRTFYDSLVTIPSSQLINSTVDNLELREYRQVKTILNLTYDTPVEKIEGFIEGVKQILETHPDTRKDNIQVFLYEFGAHSLDILLNFFLQVPDRSAELIKRQEILLAILRLADSNGVRFAFPTQSLHIESFPEEKTAIRAFTALFPKQT